MIMRSVSVIGIGETKLGKLPDRTLRDLISEAGEKAIADAGIERSMIQAAYVGNFNGGSLCGQSHLGPLTAEVLHLGNIPTIRVEGACGSGGLAFRQAYIGIMSGLYDVVLVGGVEKMTHQTTDVVTATLASAMDVDYESRLGLTFPGCFAMIANRYFHDFRNVKTEMAMCAQNNHLNASLNPDAQMQKTFTLEKILSADLIADPLSLFDCSPMTDGAAYVVLAASDIAASISKKRVIDIIGSGHSGDFLTMATRKPITTFPATVLASGQAYKQAGLTAKDIDFAEVHDCFTITQIINIEDLGFAEKGKGGDAVAAGDILRDGGRIPINVSGGLKAKGHPVGATGISQIYEIVTQLRGEAGERQLKKCDIGLAQNLGGTASTAVVHIFRGR